MNKKLSGIICALCITVLTVGGILSVKAVQPKKDVAFGQTILEDPPGRNIRKDAVNVTI